MFRTLPFEYCVRNLGRSRLRLALSIGGAAVVVLLVLAAAGFVRGMNRGLSASGGEANVVLLGAGSEDSIERSEIQSGIAETVAASIDGIRSRFGVDYVSTEVHLQIPLAVTADSPANTLVLVRGVTPAALLVHSNVQIIEGRFPRAGGDELMLGRLAEAKMGLPRAALHLGSSLLIDQRPWKIVGRFAAPGSVMESEVWAPLTDLKIATKRETDSCIVLTLESAEFEDIDAFAKQRLDLELAALPESAYYARLQRFFAPVRAVAWTTALLIGLGGLFGGLNTMYAAFASRVRELGMLQCLGFRRAAVIISLVQESVLATACGALLACLLGLILLDGLAVRFSMGTFILSMDAPVLALGLAAGLGLGLVGALPPAWRSLRLPIPESLKAL